MLMLMQLLAPGMQHREAPNLRAEMRGVPRNILERLRHGTKEQPVEQAGVLERQWPKVVRQGKDHMAVGGSEDLPLPRGEPRGLRHAVTFGAAAVPAGVVRLHLVATMIALGDMSAQGGSPAHDDSAEGSVLRAREGGPIAGQKSGAMLAHHLGHFEGWASHGSLPRSAGNARASKGLSVAWSAGCATWR